MQKTAFQLILFSCIALFLGSSCSAKYERQLGFHSNLLMELAGNKSASPQEKLDGLADSFATMLDETTNIFNPKKGAKYLKSYVDQNEQSIDLIMKDISKWQNQMTPTETIFMGVKMAQKPYVKKIINLVPKFERRYKQYTFAARILKKVKGGVIDMGKRKIGL